MSQLECQVCMAETVDRLLCGHCRSGLEQAIAELPALLDELEVTITRQDRGTGAALYAMRRVYLQLPGVHYEEGETTLIATPWPFAWDAANLGWSAVNTATTWARHLAESRGLPCPGDAQAFLLSSLDAICQDEAAGQIHDELTSLRFAILRAIDRQEPDVYAGRCDRIDAKVRLMWPTGPRCCSDLTICGHDSCAEILERKPIYRLMVGKCGANLYTRLGETEVKCEACGEVYDVRERKDQMHDTLDDQWARPHLIASALTTLDEPVKTDTIYKWIERGQVVQVAIDDEGHALYRVGDVRARIALMVGRRNGRMSG